MRTEIFNFKRMKLGFHKDEEIDLILIEIHLIHFVTV